MSQEAAEIDAGEAEAHGEGGYALSPEFVRAVADALDRDDRAALLELVPPLHAADIADLLGLVSTDERARLIEALGADLAPEALSELDEGLRDEVVELLAPEALAAAVQELETDDAVYLIEDLDEARQKEVLDAIPDEDRAALQIGLNYDDDTAGRMMQREFVAAPPYWTVGDAIDYMRERDDLTEGFYEIFLVDPAFRPIGAVPLGRLMANRRPVRLADLVEDEPRKIRATTVEEDVAYLFEQYHLISAPVVDEAGRMVGVITIDDAVGVMQDEAEEDILRLGGVVGDEELTDSVATTTQRRFVWLLVNLATAILASAVIGLFDATIEQMVALAVLMPIVASMGGNAGTQTLTVAVRALGAKDLTAANAARVIWREVLVGGANGVLFAVIMGAAAAAWFGSAGLGFVIAAAMLVNLLIAGLAGILVPLGLDRAGVDPAIASSVFVTTVTDVVGFFAFLGLAALFLL